MSTESWGSLAMALLGGGTAGAIGRELVQWLRERGKRANVDRASVTSAAHDVAESAGELVERYQRLLEDQRRQFEDALERERRHCDERIGALEQKVTELRDRIRELEDHQPGADAAPPLRKAR